METLDLGRIDFIEIKKSASQKQPKVSVIVPCFNDLRFLSESIESVLSQDFEDFELNILDNGSLDNSTDYLRTLKDSRISIYRVERNISAPKAIAFLFHRSKGEYIKVFCADDIMNRDCLSALVHKASKGFGFVCSQMNTMRENSRINSGDILGNHDISSPEDFYSHFLLHRNPVSFPTVMFARDLVSEHSFDFRFSSLFDVNLWTSILIHDCKVGVIERPLVNYRLRKNGGNYSSISQAGRRNQIFVETLLWMRNLFQLIPEDQLIRLENKLYGAPRNSINPKLNIATFFLTKREYSNHFSIDPHKIFFSQLLVESSNYNDLEFDRDREIIGKLSNLRIKMGAKYINLFIYYLKQIGFKRTILKTFRYLFR